MKSIKLTDDIHITIGLSEVISQFSVLQEIGKPIRDEI